MLVALSRDMLQNGVSHRWACVKLSTKGRVSHHVGEVPPSLTKYQAILGIAAIDGNIISRDAGPLSLPCVIL